MARAGLHAKALGAPTGGAEEDRTPDLLLAKQVLSQLSYGPEKIGSRSVVLP